MMTIHLLEDLESSLREAVQSGSFASVDDAMAKAVSLLLRQERQEQVEADPPAASEGESATTPRPIWEVLEELRKDVPPEEFLKLPRDGAEQLDHYLYGTPKRPTA